MGSADYINLPVAYINFYRNPIQNEDYAFSLSSYMGVFHK
jgi:hypothetical protein